MNTSASDEWPMETYVAAWKVFRTMSNENEKTGDHLVTRASWPSNSGGTICDVGCGDGHLLDRIMLVSQQAFKRAILIDPDEGLLSEATNLLKSRPGNTDIVAKLGNAETHFVDAAQQANVCLAVHLVYLMTNGSFVRMLKSLPKDVPLYVVLDHPNSVFTRLWERTAPKYFERAKQAHDHIQNLPEDSYTVESSSIDSSISSPFATQQSNDVRLAVLSLLCYSDARTMRDDAMLTWIKSIINDATVDNHVVCESCCYEVIRT